MDSRKIFIEASPEQVFDEIDNMPNKFPVFRIMDTTLMFFLRVSLVDGYKSAKTAVKEKRKAVGNVRLKPGDIMGPFTLSEVERPVKYFFEINSKFFRGKTGYILCSENNGTKLSLDTIAENPHFAEMIWWLLVKPVHIIFSNKVLRVIRERVEKH